MSRRGAFLLAASSLFVMLELVAAAAQEETSRDLTYNATAIEGGILDLVYPVQDTAGGAAGTTQASNQAKGNVQDLEGGVADLKAAGADIKETASEIKISLQGEILFDFDKSTLRPAAEPTLTQIAGLIKKTTKPKVLIEGYTDSKGSSSYNMKLSDRRAASVKTWLTTHGIAAAAVRTQGLGATKPVAPNKKSNGEDDPEGRQKNRRVEITIKK